jgi:FMN phosphatase YigB (HAD superfamily)
MGIPVSDFDPGHAHLAALMHRQGVTRVEISIEEMDAVLDFIKANHLQMVVMTNQDGAVIEFLHESLLEGVARDGTAAGAVFN